MNGLVCTTNGTEILFCPEGLADATVPEGVVEIQSEAFSDYAAALSTLTGKIGQNGEFLQVWHDVVADTDPLDPDSKFTASIVMVDGLPVVSWNPNLGVDLVYRTYGCTASGRDWVDITELSEEQKSPHRFFMVTVEMP